MSERFLIAVVVGSAVGLSAFTLWADVPDPGYSDVQWGNTVDDTTVMICPSCDASYMQVYVKDESNSPVVGVLVSASFGSPSVHLVGPVEGYTDPSGYVELNICGGLDASTVEQSVSSSITVMCLGVTLYYSPAKDVLSPDMCQGPFSVNIVEALDFAVFATDWLSLRPGSRSNFNRLCNESGGECVGGLDYSIFASHWLHQ
ncbi:MAG: hypothetical protein AMJ46_10490 [Latescibacteria bacterium DG_63]|nr:MAG: hypothetical protein AMJ46_10490 [Latescibacteria bacterium DG_63]